MAGSEEGGDSSPGSALALETGAETAVPETAMETARGSSRHSHRPQSRLPNEPEDCHSLEETTECHAGTPHTAAAAAAAAAAAVVAAAAAAAAGAAAAVETNHPPKFAGVPDRKSLQPRVCDGVDEQGGDDG